MERTLLVLGLLMSQSQHGYQINEFIDRNLGQVSNMKKATAYAILNRLEKSGDVVSSISQEGNRPVKKIYTITEQGKKKFQELLRKELSNLDDTVPSGNIGIMFLHHLTLPEVLQCFTERLKKVEQRLEMYRHMPKHGRNYGLGVDLAIQHRMKLITADRDWLLEAIETLKKELGESENQGGDA